MSHSLAIVVPDHERASLAVIRDRCRQVYDRRNDVIGHVPFESVDHWRRGFDALERYVQDKETRDAVRRSARVLEMAVGAALGPSPKHGPGRGKKTFAAANVLSPWERATFRLMYEYRQIVEKQIAKTGVSRAQVLKAIEQQRRLEKVKTQNVPTDLVVIGDFREKLATLHDESASLFLTDPPYDTKSIELYGAVAQHAARILMPGGSLLAYVGAYQHMEKILGLMSQSLRPWWQITVVYTGGTLARMREYGVVVGCKAIVWYVKGSRGDKDIWVNSVIEKPASEKDHHDWQQGENEAKYLIESLTKPGELVVDPMCGGGTTAVASKRLNRRFWTCEIDSDTAAIAAARIADA